MRARRLVYPVRAPRSPTSRETQVTFVWRESLPSEPAAGSPITPTDASLALTAGDVVAVVVQSLEHTGHNVQLTPNSVVAAKEAAVSLLVALGVAPSGGQP